MENTTVNARAMKNKSKYPEPIIDVDEASRAAGKRLSHRAKIC